MKKIIVSIIGILIVIGIVLYTNKTPSKETLTIKGSDTEVQLVSNLVEAFLKNHKNADISVTGGGSGVGIAAILNKEVDVANSSRPMTDKEKNQAKEKQLEIPEFIVARDGLSIIVHPKNSVKELTIQQIAGLYTGTITNWKDIGGEEGPVVLYGRQNTSGTYVFFRDTVLKNEYASSMRTMEGNQAIFDAVKNDEQGIGYVGVGYVVGENGLPKKDVQIIPVKKDSESPAVFPLDKAAVKKGEYPIFRPIYQYLSHVPKKNSLLDALLRFESSAEGAAIIEKTGFYTVTQDDEKRNAALFDTIR